MEPRTENALVDGDGARIDGKAGQHLTERLVVAGEEEFVEIDERRVVHDAREPACGVGVGEALGEIETALLYRPGNDTNGNLSCERPGGRLVSSEELLSYSRTRETPCRIWKASHSST